MEATVVTAPRQPGGDDGGWKGKLTDRQIRQWVKAGVSLAKSTAARDWTVRYLAEATLAKKLVSLAHSTQVSYGRHKT
jgi:hypothetical protein